MGYFRFYPDCHYVQGPTRSALYCLSENKIIHFSKDEAHVIRLWLDNESVEEVREKKSKIAVPLLFTLIEKGIGTTYDSPVFAEPYELIGRVRIPGLLETAPKMKAAYIQVTSNCNATCNFCKNKDYYVYNGCTSCVRWPYASDRDRGETDYEALNTVLSDLETPQLVFNGGNPLLCWDKVMDLFSRAVEHNPDVRGIVITNGSGLSDAILNDARWNNINFVFTVFSNSRKGYIAVTGDPNLFDELLRAVERCKTNNVGFGFTLFTTPETRDQYDAVVKLVHSLGGTSMNKTEAIDKNRAKKPIKLLNEGEHRFHQFSAPQYFTNREVCQCLAGSVAISASGEIFPCPLSSRKLGTMPSDSVHSVIRSGALPNIWKENKDTIEHCKACEMRYACNGCNVVEKTQLEDPNMHDVICTYRPETGLWSNENTKTEVKERSPKTRATKRKMQTDSSV